ncbi:metallophosphoesterase [Serratia sp. M24T3]|uniref:metallophosphoesterase n=1 Tax=Serratia sp. M24T3 TaxID=932213 RepID=UPI00025BA690|nr:metallophosphoesterase [Serratia sp. M24T3]EIC85281.1 metallophosphoesterase [Serratia sp. M24T3]
MTIHLTAEQLQALGNVSAIYQIPKLAETPHSSTTLRFGLIADPQYADAEPSATHPRFYRNSLCKLSKAITELNDHRLEFVVTLGDLVDRDWASFDAILPVYDALRHPHAVVIGNHDAQVLTEHLSLQTPAIGLPKSYYQFAQPGYRFIVIDGNDLSLYCNSGNGVEHQQAQQTLAKLMEQQLPNAQSWNGAVGSQQLVWLEQALQQAQQQRETVLVFGHYPLAPENKHNLWNCEQLVELLCRYQVRAYFAGHDHEGNYARIENTDFITLKGMVDGADRLPFAMVELKNGELTINGYGPEISRVLPLEMPVKASSIS